MPVPVEPRRWVLIARLIGTSFALEMFNPTIQVMDSYLLAMKARAAIEPPIA